MWTAHRNFEYIRSAKRLNSRQACWSLFFFFFPVFDFTISFRSGSKDLKLDVLSRQFGSSEEGSFAQPILRRGCVVGALVWGVERPVRRALTHIKPLKGCPEGKLFVSESEYSRLVIFVVLWQLVLSALKPSPVIHLPQVCFNLTQFLLALGPILLWIS